MNMMCAMAIRKVRFSSSLHTNIDGTKIIYKQTTDQIQEFSRYPVGLRPINVADHYQFLNRSDLLHAPRLPRSSRPASARLDSLGRIAGRSELVDEPLQGCPRR